MRDEDNSRDKVPGLIAPGLLERHYSPRTKLSLLNPGERPPAPPRGQRAAWVRLRRVPNLSFALDNAFDAAERIATLLNSGPVEHDLRDKNGD